MFESGAWVWVSGEAPLMLLWLNKQDEFENFYQVN